MSAALEVAPGQFTVPQNRWDLLPRPRRAPSVSVIVPFYEQQADLERLLVGVELQEGHLDLRETIVVDDGSAIGPVVPPWYAGPPVVTLRQADLGFRAGAARNLGASRATGDVLVFLDADMVPTPTFVAQMAGIPAVAPEAMVVGTRRHWDLEGWSAQQVRAWLQGGAPPRRLEDPAWLADEYARAGDLLEISERTYQWMISAALAMPRRWFVELGGFDESICTYGGEDWELAYRAQNAGALMAHSQAVAHHNGGDWASRGGTTATKNPERCALAARIPGRHDPILGRFALIVVHLDASGTNADEVVECVATVLSAAPTTVAVSLPGLPIGAQSLFAHDPRVHLGTLPPSLQDRALVAVELRRPIRFGPGSFDCILDRLRPGGPARLTVCDGEHDLMTCVATRAERRVARWAPRVDAGSLWTELFGPPERCTPHEVDVEPVTSPVDLALTFPR